MHHFDAKLSIEFHIEIQSNAVNQSAQSNHQSISIFLRIFCEIFENRKSRKNEYLDGLWTLDSRLLYTTGGFFSSEILSSAVLTYV